MTKAYITSHLPLTHSGADTTLATFVTRNLIPVTIGNILAGSVCVAAAYSVLYGRLGKRLAGEATD